MNHEVKNKLLTGLVLLLLIANAATITIFWLGRDRHPLPPKGSPADYLAKELKLDATQQEKLGLLVKEHRDAVDKLRRDVRESKDKFFDLLNQPGVTDSLKNEAAKAVSAITEKIDLLTLDHFRKIKELCNGEQQKKFNSIIHEVTKMLGPPRPPGGPGGPPAGGDRPPPPGE